MEIPQKPDLDPNRPRYDYSVLKKNPPPLGVDKNFKESYLSDEQF